MSSPEKWKILKKPQSIKKLAELLATLPGIGPRMAERIVFFSIKKGAFFIDELSDAFSVLKSLIQCERCLAIGERNPCEICADVFRDAKKLAVVEKLADVEAIEKTGKYNGLYFISGGLISPLDGYNVSDFPVAALKKRITEEKIEEIIIATDPNTKGETTALFIIESLKDFDIKLTRLAYGLPFGGDLEYADELTLSSAIEGRREVLKK